MFYFPLIETSKSIYCDLKMILKFIFSEKATTFCEIFAVDLTVTTVEISQKIVAFSEYMNFNSIFIIAVRKP